MRRLRASHPAVFLMPLALVMSGCGPKKEATADEGTKAKAEAEAEAEAQPDPEASKTPEAPDNSAAWAGWMHTDVPAGLAAPPAIPEHNPMSAEKIALGHQLFMDKRLSFDGSRSCYSCHQNHLGNADGRKTAMGAGDKPLTRNSPTIWNVAYHQELYWDGRASSLEAQAIGAWKGGNMGVGADNLDAKAAEIAALPEYAEAFGKVFELEQGAAVTPQHVAMALSAYERTLLCGDTAYDRRERSQAAKRGWDLFRGKAQCVACHNGDNFSDGLYHAAGIGFDEAGQAVGSPDVGRGKPAEDQAQNYRFRTPTLRNVARTAPYFHDGSEPTLEGAVRYMAGGGNPKAPNHDPLLKDMKLSDAEIKDVVAFLESLDCTDSLEEIGDQRVPGVIAPAEG